MRRHCAAFSCSCQSPCCTQTGGSPQSGSASAAPTASQTLTPVEPIPDNYQIGSPYIPVDNWIYPAMLRLFSLGYGDSAYIGLRPWTRESTRTILRETTDKLNAGSNNEEARQIYNSVRRELMQDPEFTPDSPGWMRLDTVYTRLLGLAGTPLNDSFHAGQTYINDYGRPNQAGFNNITGFSATSEGGGSSRSTFVESTSTPHPAPATPFLSLRLFPRSTRFLTGLRRIRSKPGPFLLPMSSALSKPTSRPTWRTTSFRSARVTSGWAPPRARAWHTVTMPRTSTPSASTWSIRSVSSDSLQNHRPDPLRFSGWQPEGAHLLQRALGPC